MKIIIAKNRPIKVILKGKTPKIRIPRKGSRKVGGSITDSLRNA